MKINKNTNLAVINLLILLAYADDNYSEPEHKFILGICNELDISEDNLNNLIDQNKNDSDSLVSSCKFALSLITDTGLQNKTIELLSELAATDHIIHENELLVLQLIAENWGMYKSA